MMFETPPTINQSWKTVTSVEQWKQILEDSKTSTLAIFKHSTRCSRSMFAKHRLEDGYDIGEEDLTFYYVDLLAHRDVSNAIAEDLGILHQSPQLIVIKHGRVVHHSTHESIELHSVKESL